LDDQRGGRAETITNHLDMADLAQPKIGYRPALDGFRGVSIILVLAIHAGAYGYMGRMGVDMFFVLSGFLITSLLLEEWDENGCISLKRFYARRVLRLFPALIAVLLALMVFIFFRGNAYEIRRMAMQCIAALFYAMNWCHVFNLFPASMIGHAWTLSIEEQFYLIWPLLLLLMLHRTSGRSSMLCWLLLALALGVIERIILNKAFYNSVRIMLGTDTESGPLICGCCAAVILRWKMLSDNRWLKNAIRIGAWAAAAYLVWLACSPNWYVNEMTYMMVDYFIGISATLILFEIIMYDYGAMGRLLSWRPLNYIGKISYGLYLWHLPIFRLVAEKHWPIGKEVVVELGIAFTITIISFYCLERPFLNLKRRFHSADKNSALHPVLQTTVTA
jgi:peptidoglycan/LPS O-acetylase OafA/YrhL